MKMIILTNLLGTFGLPKQKEMGQSEKYNGLACHNKVYLRHRAWVEREHFK